MTAILCVLRICSPFPVDKLMNAHVGDDDDDDDVMRMGNVDDESLTNSQVFQ